MNPRAAVSRYRVNKVGKTGRICAISKRSFSIWSGFFREPESSRDALAGKPPIKKEAGVKAALLQVPVESGQ
jgi:hypothetical protein